MQIFGSEFTKFNSKHIAFIIIKLLNGCIWGKFLNTIKPKTMPNGLHPCWHKNGKVNTTTTYRYHGP